LSQLAGYCILWNEDGREGVGRQASIEGEVGKEESRNELDEHSDPFLQRFRPDELSDGFEPLPLNQGDDREPL